MQKGTETKEISQRSTIFWDVKKKRPSNYTFIILIILTIIFLVSGVISTIASYHEIKIVIESDFDCHGNVEYKDNSYRIDRGRGLREFSYQIRLGLNVQIFIYKSNYQSDITMFNFELYDNEELVEERTSWGSSASFWLQYRVGEN